MKGRREKTVSNPMYRDLDSPLNGASTSDVVRISVPGCLAVSLTLCLFDTPQMFQGGLEASLGASGAYLLRAILAYNARSRRPLLCALCANTARCRHDHPMRDGCCRKRGTLDHSICNDISSVTFLTVCLSCFTLMGLGAQLH